MKTMHERKKRLARAALLACMGAGTALLMVPLVSTAHSAGAATDAPAPALAGVSQAQPLRKAPIADGDLASLRNGARHYLQSCIGCHSAAHMSYDRLQDIGITADDLLEWMPEADPPQPGAALLSPLGAQQGKDMFGVAPPDLSLATRAQGSWRHDGADHVYSYLRGFYRDPASRTGWNNTVVPGTVMPHVLAALQAPDGADAVATNGTDSTDSTLQQAVNKLAANAPDSAQGHSQLSAAAYDKTLADITHFMQWMAEPGRQARKRAGWFVCALFAAFAFAVWRLHASYWKDVQ